MRLNLPIDLHDSTVLLAGAGGGWDVFGAVPLAHELEQRNCRVILANYSSSVGGFDLRPAGACWLIRSRPQRPTPMCGQPTINCGNRWRRISGPTRTSRCRPEHHQERRGKGAVPRGTFGIGTDFRMLQPRGPIPR